MMTDFLGAILTPQSKDLRLASIFDLPAVDLQPM